MWSRTDFFHLLQRESSLLYTGANVGWPQQGHGWGWGGSAAEGRLGFQECVLAELRSGLFVVLGALRMRASSLRLDQVACL